MATRVETLEDEIDLDQMNDKLQLSNERFESQDDLVDDYDSFTSSPKCLNVRSFCERLLLFFVFVLLVVVVALTVAFVKASQPSDKDVSMCTTSDCVTASSSILLAMDNASDPCMDFYQYSCGGWVRSTPIPKGKLSWDRFQELSDHTYYTLETIFEDDTHLLHSEAELKAKRFYRSCMEGGISSGTPIIQMIRNYKHVLRKLDHAGQTNGMLEYAHKHGAYPLFSFGVARDPEIPHKNIIKIGFPTFDINQIYFLTPNQSKSQQAISAYRKRLVDISSSLKQTYPLMADHVDDVMEFITLLAKASPSLEKRENTYSYHRYNLTEMDSTFPLMEGFSWTKYINSYWKDVGETPPASSNQVAVVNSEYLHNLTTILKQYTRRNDTRSNVILEYITHTLVSSLDRYVTNNAFRYSPAEPLDEWKRCIFYTNQAFSYVTGALYLNSSYQRSHVQEVHLLIKFIKEAFKDYLLQKFWMDKPTRKLAAEKIDAIIDRVSYSSLLMNTTFLDDFYKNLSVNDSDWFQSVINWRTFHVNKIVRSLEESPTRESWLSAPVTVNTFYSPERNDLFFPAAVFQPPFFSPGWPQAMNFGALGSIIGHEITHAFDVLGRQFDKDGRLGNWWGNVTSQGYERAVPCMKRQYGEYSERGYAVNGELTATENVADNGGLRAALLGYRLWKLTTTERKVLPGVNLTGDQLFYLSFAQTYCAKYTDSGAFLVTHADTHSPHPVRVRGTIMNSESFSNVHGCGLHATMNSRIKCIVW